MSSAALPSSNAARVIFVNPSSGPSDTDVDALRERFTGYSVVETDAGELDDAIRKALDDGATVIGVAGGDGSVSCAAQHLSGTDTPLLVIPAGTRNHFAHDVGIDDLDAAAAAAHSDRSETVDLGEVNGRPFVNNASLGTYVRLVHKREQYEARFRKQIANVIAAWSELRHGRHVSLELDGQPTRVWALFVGNGEYGEGLRDVTQRESLQEGCLDVWIVRSRGRFSRLRVTAAVLFGRLDASPLIDRVSVGRLRVDTRHHAIGVACDGEVEQMRPPLEFTIRRGALRVLLPPNGDGGSPT
ncbi:MAG: hypothetical protein QOJ00_1419 [Actinomycetota bacterium]